MDDAGGVGEVVTEFGHHHEGRNHLLSDVIHLWIVYLFNYIIQSIHLSYCIRI